MSVLIILTLISYVKKGVDKTLLFIMYHFKI